MNEKEYVRKLGEQIGYGNMMHLASECWQEMLTEEYGSPAGAFTVGLPVGANDEQYLPEEIHAVISAGDWLRLKETDNQNALRNLEKYCRQTPHDERGLVNYYDWLKEGEE